MGVNFGVRAGIEQRMNIYLADVSRPEITVGLARKAVGCARVIACLRRKRSGGANCSGGDGKI
jgi:hypothetical protein